MYYENNTTWEAIPDEADRIWKVIIFNNDFLGKRDPNANHLFYNLTQQALYRLQHNQQEMLFLYNLFLLQKNNPGLRPTFERGNHGFIIGFGGMRLIYRGIRAIHGIIQGITGYKVLFPGLRRHPDYPDGEHASTFIANSDIVYRMDKEQEYRPLQGRNLEYVFDEIVSGLKKMGNNIQPPLTYSIIKSLYIDNFKSLVAFKIELADFVCLVGLNGAGKSTVLQALDFVAQLMRGDMDAWLEQRNWLKSELNSSLSRKNNIAFSLELKLASHGPATWTGNFNLNSLHCTSESIVFDGQTVLQVERGVCTLTGTDSRPAADGGRPKAPAQERFPIVFDYQGSILSQLKQTQIEPLLQDIKNHIAHIHALDLLSPALLRIPSRRANGGIGLGGERLSAYIDESGKAAREDLQRILAKVYRQLESIETRALPAGWKQLEIVENYADQRITTNARHINDGMLRLLAILSQLHKNYQLLLFDEIENGINPELVAFLIEHLLQAGPQVLVTTHSPMILNYLPDAIARQGVIYLYKNKRGLTRAVRLFDIPSLAAKLGFMGPGEAFVDTDQTQLYLEIEAQSAEASE